MWVWGSDTVLDQTSRNKLLDFAVASGINRLYSEAEGLVIHEQSTLADFIRASRARGIEVELLFGMREWAFEENHHQVLALADQVIDYTRKYPDALPVAMHLDIEPWSLQEWADDVEGIANQLLDLFDKVRARLHEIDLPLTVDIPVWFDRVPVSRDGRPARPLYQLVIDAVDGVTLMNYRNTYQRLIDDAAPELLYASGAGKPVVVGVETLCIEPASITFCGIGRDVMESKLASLDLDMPLQYSSYSGHAVHHFWSFRDLAP